MVDDPSQATFCKRQNSEDRKGPGVRGRSGGTGGTHSVFRDVRPG